MYLLSNIVINVFLTRALIKLRKIGKSVSIYDSTNEIFALSTTSIFFVNFTPERNVENSENCESYPHRYRTNVQPVYILETRGDKIELNPRHQRQYFPRVPMSIRDRNRRIKQEEVSRDIFLLCALVAINCASIVIALRFSRSISRSRKSVVVVRNGTKVARV